MIRNEIKEKLVDYKQNHLIRFYDSLNDKQKNILEKELEALDFEILDTLKKDMQTREEKKSVYEPLEALRIEDIDKKKEEYVNVGIDAINKGKIGAVLLAGGQGTRLGFDKPKGMFNIGVNKTLYIFQRLIMNIQEVVKQSGCYIPLMIMTSQKNDEETRLFFKENDYFGYDKEYIFFFVQDMAPSVNYDGKFLLEEKYKLSLSPNGNGGWFSSLNNSGLLNKVKEMGVEWLNVFAVDNVLQKIADPSFIGATILSGCPAGSKVVKKVTPDERVGVMCRENGKPSIVEYYELTDEMKNAKDSHGEPAYNYGVILNYLLKIESLENINNKKLPFHIVEKKIPYIDGEGNYIKPTEPNGYKFEELILDMIRLLDDCLVYEVDRKKEFAPVKNKEGVDSIVTARQLLVENGVQI